MELANKLLDLIKNERYTEWPRKKLIEKADEFKRNYENKILVKENMELDGRARTIYPTVSEALKNSRDDDTIVTACGLYKVFTTYQDYLQYITNMYENGKFSKIDEVPHFQIIPDDTVQNLVIGCTDLDAEVLQDVIDELLIKFRDLKPEHIRCFPANESVFIVLTSMCGSFSKNHHKILDFIDDNIMRNKLSCLSMMYDQKSQKSYIEIPIRLVECVPGDMCKPVDPKMHINITNITDDQIALSKKLEIESPSDWILQNSPIDKLLNKYYNKFIKSTGCDMSRRKFHALIEKRGYRRKKTNIGLVWVR